MMTTINAVSTLDTNLLRNHRGIKGCSTPSVRTKFDEGHTLINAESTLKTACYKYFGFKPHGSHTMHVGLVILRARRKHDLGRTEFAKLANRFAYGDCYLTKQDIANYENGYYSPKLDKAMLIAAALKELNEAETPAEAMGYCDLFI